jgi:hypothetical protein
MVVVLLLPLSLQRTMVQRQRWLSTTAVAGAVAAVEAVAVAFNGVQWRRQHLMEATQQPASAVRGRHNKRTRGRCKER